MILESVNQESVSVSILKCYMSFPSYTLPGKMVCAQLCTQWAMCIVELKCSDGIT